MVRGFRWRAAAACLRVCPSARSVRISRSRGLGLRGCCAIGRRARRVGFVVSRLASLAGRTNASVPTWACAGSLASLAGRTNASVPTQAVALASRRLSRGHLARAVPVPCGAAGRVRDKNRRLPVRTPEPATRNLETLKPCNFATGLFLNVRRVRQLLSRCCQLRQRRHRLRIGHSAVRQCRSFKRLDQHLNR